MKNNYLIHTLLIYLFLGTIISCEQNYNNKLKKKSHPSHKYDYVDVDVSMLKYYEMNYLPIYSDIYHQDGTRRFKLTTTISIRNISLSDSAFILSATYHDSYGTLLHDYVDSTIHLSPLESIEFVVEEKENIGGAGANFIIEWGANKYTNQILIQSIMIGTYGQQGISFISEAVMMDSLTKKN
ncbi:DUF3124 domain-containing protein [Bacteroidota bacterium]